MKSVGSLIEKMKLGDAGPKKHNNPFLCEALELQEFVLTADELKGRFPNIFKNNSLPIVLEIGCYMGKTVVDFAIAKPELNILGLDITYQRVARAGRKIKNLGIPNASIGICDAMNFLAAVPDDSLQGICVFFPDPWPKTRHIKNRLLQTSFFELAKRKITPTGFVWLKTDHEQYFKDATAAALEAKMVIQKEHACPELLGEIAFETQFEKLFKSKNLPIYIHTFLKN